MNRRLPIGVQTLLTIRDRNCYYVDKTPLIRDLIQRGKHFSSPARAALARFTWWGWCSDAAKETCWQSGLIAVERRGTSPRGWVVLPDRPEAMILGNPGGNPVGPASFPLVGDAAGRADLGIDSEDQPALRPGRPC